MKDKYFIEYSLYETTFIKDFENKESAESFCCKLLNSDIEGNFKRVIKGKELKINSKVSVVCCETIEKD